MTKSHAILFFFCGETRLLGDAGHIQNGASAGGHGELAVPFIRQFGSASVGGCGNSGTALAALDDTDGNMAKIYGWHLLSVGIFQASWSRTNAKRLFGCAGRTRGLGSVAPHRARRAQQPPAGRTTPATVYKCALVNKGLTACPRISAVLRPVPPPPEGGTGQSGTP